MKKIAIEQEKELAELVNIVFQQIYFIIALFDFTLQSLIISTPLLKKVMKFSKVAIDRFPV